ncbi:uncharacterized protein LOC110252137 isoform X2 [Exaiptasia diaphana]|nr:uncharacterized protein LOC110252137 isoform X2 [Exaiptasia diaphana]
MDLGLIGDFSCDKSVLPDKCAFNVRPFPYGKKYCSMMSQCQGFVYNSGLNMVVLKNTVKGAAKYSPGFELHIKSYYHDSVNITLEECAATIEKESTNSGLACNLPKINPFDESLMGLIKDKQLDCKGTPVTRYEDGILTFMTDGNSIDKVTYETITRENQDFGYGVGKTGTLTRTQNTAVLNEDSVRVIYYENSQKQVDFHMSISPSQVAVSRQGEKPNIPLDIMVLGFDSTSLSHFQRKLPKVKKILQEDLEAWVYNGYSIVGDGTTPAFLAMLAGKDEKELSEARKSKNGDYIDKWPFIFKKLHQHGYATFFSEDQAKYASVHYRLKGFYKQPVDHWMRHFWLAASDHTNGKEYWCLGTEPAYRKRFRNIKSFYKAYPKQRKFSFSFFTIGHDDVNALGYLQDDFVTFLKDMKSSGYLDNTFLVVMGDHGIRYGAIRKTMLGKLEERLPLLSISVPQWFKNQYPEHSRHLGINTNRLTSPYDLHATFQQILSKNHQKTYKHGQSLFTEISKSRTCDEAGNPEHFCPCVNWKPVDPHHKHIKQIGQETVNFINKLIQKENLQSKCAMLSLQKVSDPVYVAPNEHVQSFGGSADVDGRVVTKGAKPKGMCSYQVQVTTSPNGGVYEVTGHVTSMNPYVNPEISRLDEYRDQPKCIMESHPHMRKFCYCSI